MKTYFFALGTNHTLSKIDIVNTLLQKSADFEIVEASQEILIISTNNELMVRELMEELGSAAKIGEVFGVYEKDKWPDKFLEDILEERLREKLKGEKFGISVYGAGGKYKELNEVFYSRSKITEKVRDLGALREVREEGRILSTVAVDKNGLLNNGFELVICAGSRGVYVGKTLAIQDYESYSFRDYSRPGKDTRSGMIPPKLAKMMINLAGKSKDSLFLDSFCGSGTFLQELILLNYKKVIGTDLEEKAVNDTRKNLDWLFDNYPNLKKNNFEIEVGKLDAKELSDKFLPKSIDAIVTEPYLGSLNRKFLNQGQIKNEVTKLEELYLAAFNEFSKVLKNDGVVVIIFPVFRFQNDFYRLQILDKIANFGFKSGKILPEEIKGTELLKLQITNRHSIDYFRPGQMVSREIFTFRLS